MMRYLYTNNSTWIYLIKLYETHSSEYIAKYMTKSSSENNFQKYAIKALGVNAV